MLYKDLKYCTLFLLSCFVYKKNDVFSNQKTDTLPMVRAQPETYRQLLMPKFTIPRSIPLTLGFQNENKPFKNMICSAFRKN